jgi:hypothetical protein
MEYAMGMPRFRSLLSQPPGESWHSDGLSIRCSQQSETMPFSNHAGSDVSLLGKAKAGRVTPAATFVCSPGLDQGNVDHPGDCRR